MTPAPPRVFLSYSFDSPEHRQRVLVLAERLRAGGIDATVDQYIETAGPPEGWPRWMDTQLRTADFVLLVCSGTYRRRVEGREEPGQGHGVLWEGNLIYQHLYNAASRNEKFIPVLLAGATPDDIPLPLQGVTYYRVEDEEGYNALYRRLTGQEGVKKGELGRLRPLPPGTVTLPQLAAAARPRGKKAIVGSVALTIAVLAGLWLLNRVPAEYNVRVTVLDPGGNPLQDAQVTSSNGGEFLRSDSGWELRIRASSVPGGKLVIRAAVPASFLYGKRELQLGNEPTLTTTVQLSAKTDALVRGTVLDSAQRAVAGAHVTIAGHTDEAFTDASGAFLLPAHAAEGQTVQLRVEKSGYSPTTQWHPAGATAAVVILDR